MDTSLEDIGRDLREIKQQLDNLDARFAQITEQHRQLLKDSYPLLHYDM